MAQRRRTALLLAALAVLATAGCGERKIQDPPDQPPATVGAATAIATASGEGPAPAAREPAATLLVTEDFGRVERTAVAVAPEQSVLSALRSVTDVDTTYGGRYVQGIDGLQGSLEQARDWLFFVNGIESPLGADDVRVHDGDHIWWDYRRWRSYLHVPVVVGAWPEPFLHGEGGRAPIVSADAPLDGALQALGADVRSLAPLYRVVVGSDADLRKREDAWRRAAAHPQREGLTVWLQDGRVRAWDAVAGKAVDVPQARAIAVAITARVDPADGVVLAVVGLDDDAAQVAAARLAADPAVLQRRYAVAFDGGGEPLAAGGLGTSR